MIVLQKVIYDVQPGDVLLWDHNLFHKTEPVQNDTNKSAATTMEPK